MGLTQPTEKSVLNPDFIVGDKMSGYRFRCLGPFEFPVYRSTRHWKNHYRLFDPKTATEAVFEQAARQEHRIGVEGIDQAIGLYIIGMKPRGKLIPFYVGKAARQTIKERLFQKQDKLTKVTEILNVYKHAKPFVFLFPLLTPTGRLSRLPTATPGGSAAEKVINSAEYMMIGHAMNSNPWLHNISTVVERERFSIDGSPGASGKQTKDAQSYSEMMGFRKASSANDQLREAGEAIEEIKPEETRLIEDALAHPESLEQEAVDLEE